MPALPQTYPYKSGPIEPIVSPGEVVGIWVNKVYKFYRVQYIDGIMRSDPLEFDLGAIAAATVQTAVTQLNLLEMPDLEFGQFRAEVLDDFTAMLYQGRSDQRHKTNVRVATYSRFGAQRDPDGHQGEFFVFEDNWAYMQGANQTDYALTQARVVFWGYRFVLEDLNNQYQYPGKLPTSWTRVPATAHL